MQKRPVNSYDILRIAPDVTQSEVHAAYRKLAMQYHPDRHDAGQRDVAMRRFQLLQAAYDKVKTPENRKAYNHWLATNTHAVLAKQSVVVNDNRKQPLRNFMETLETIFWPIERDNNKNKGRK